MSQRCEDHPWCREGFTEIERTLADSHATALSGKVAACLREVDRLQRILEKGLPPATANIASRAFARGIADHLFAATRGGETRDLPPVRIAPSQTEEEEN